MDRPWNGFSGKNQPRGNYGQQANGISPIGMPVGGGGLGAAAAAAGVGGWSKNGSGQLAVRAQVSQLSVGSGNLRGPAGIPQYLPVPGGVVLDSPGPVHGHAFRKVVGPPLVSDGNAATGNADGILSSPHPEKSWVNAYSINGNGNNTSSSSSNSSHIPNLPNLENSTSSASCVMRSPARTLQGHPTPLPPVPPSPSSNSTPGSPAPATPSSTISCGSDSASLLMPGQSLGQQVDVPGGHALQPVTWMKTVSSPSILPTVMGVPPGSGISSERGMYHHPPSMTYTNGDGSVPGREWEYLLTSPVGMSPRDPPKANENQSIRRQNSRDDKGRGKFGGSVVAASNFNSVPPPVAPRLKVMLMADGTRHVSMEDGPPPDHPMESGSGRTSFSGRGGGSSKHNSGGSNKSGFGGTSRRTMPSDHNSATARIWYYKDTANVEHGPQTMQELVQWHKEGYFDSNLLVREKGHNVWKTLTEICMERAPKSPQAMGCVSDSLGRVSGQEAHLSVLGLPSSMKQLSINPGMHNPTLSGGSGGRGRGHSRSLSAEHDLRTPHSGQYRHSPDPIVLRKSQSAHYPADREFVRRGVGSESGSGVFFQSGADTQRSPSEASGIEGGRLISVDPDKQSDYAEKLFKATEEWFYIDPNGSLQGPFNGERMYKWWKRGYFTDTKFRRGSEGQFYTLPELIACLSMDVHEGSRSTDCGSGSMEGDGDGEEGSTDEGMGSSRFGRDMESSRGLERIPEKNEVDVQDTTSHLTTPPEETRGRNASTGASGLKGSDEQQVGDETNAASAGDCSGETCQNVEHGEETYDQFNNETGAGSVEAVVAVNALCNEAGDHA